MKTEESIYNRKIKVINALEQLIIEAAKGNVSDKAILALPETVHAYNELLNSL